MLDKEISFWNSQNLDNVMSDTELPLCIIPRENGGSSWCCTEKHQLKHAVNNFNSWANERSKRGPSYCVPPNLLKSHNAELVAKWLCLFVMETHREVKKPCPPSTIRSGLNRVLQSNKTPFSVLNKGDICFSEFLNTLGTLMSGLYRDGIGVCKDSAIAISPEHEELFWRKNMLGYSSPKVL